ncbi:MAG: TetR/AcrR family transcriptional regulator [Solidesulfovibrio sp. DCME]|uniref:TetR/AcrR family transcriptional regulator n=1 Tax=Solidesulfovibrio sp. DCME TaxID=3447380 RepID=UPI003D134E4A
MDASRQAVIEAAARLFANLGRDGVGPRDLVRRLGFSPESVYRHFKNRDELFAAVLTRLQGELFTHIEAACPEAAGETGLAMLLALAEAYCRFLEERPAAYGDIVSVAGRGRGQGAGESSRELDRLHARIVRQFEVLLHLGRLDGSVRDDSPETARRVVNVVIGLTRLSLVAPKVRAANLRGTLSSLVAAGPAGFRAA